MYKPKLFLLVPSTEYHQIGGAERVIKNYTKLASLEWGFDVQIITSKPTISNNNPIPENHILLDDFPQYYNNQIIPLKTVLTLRKLIQEIQPQIIHVFSIGSLDLLDQVWKSLRPFKVIFSFFETPYLFTYQNTGLSADLTPDLHYLKSPWTRYSPIANATVSKGHFDAFVPFSNLYGYWGYEILGVPKNIPCITALPTIEDFNVFENLKPPIEELSQGEYIMAVGRTVPRKGFLSLLGALQQNIHLTKNIRILFTDPRPNDSFHANYKRKVISQLKNFPNLVMLPPDLSSRELNFLYKNARCVLFPSIHEGYGLVPFEAACMGCPTIGFNIPGTEHTLVQNRNGWRVNSYDWQSFIELTEKIWKKQSSMYYQIDKNSISKWAKYQQKLAHKSWEGVRKLLDTSKFNL